MKPNRPQNLFAAALVAALALHLVSPPRAHAQSEESEPAPARGEFEAAPLPPPEKPFLVPDVPQSLVDQTQIKERWITLKAGLVTLADYTAFNQDSVSLGQVGQQRDQWEARAARLMFRGTIGTDYKISYLVAGEYKGFESDPEKLWSLTDLSFIFPLGSPATKLTVGKTKETSAYKMVGDAANLPHQERMLTPFFVSRNVGLKLTQVIGQAQRMTASAGADNNTLRFKGRPESNVADNYVDTGDLPGDHAWHLGLEALWNEGPFSVLAECNRAWVNSPASGDPNFSGCYVTASWILAGETRPYDRTVGYARRVMPAGRWGAPELVARFSHETSTTARSRAASSTRPISASTGGPRGAGSWASAGVTPGWTVSPRLA